MYFSIVFLLLVLFSFTEEEFLYQDHWGRICLLNFANLTERVLMSNVTYVSYVIVTFHFFFSPSIVYHLHFISYSISITLLWMDGWMNEIFICCCIHKMWMGMWNFYFCFFLFFYQFIHFYLYRHLLYIFRSYFRFYFYYLFAIAAVLPP